MGSKPSGETARRHETIRNKRGLHARAAAKLVKLAASFEAEIKIVKDGKIVSGRSIMGLMMLAASIGTAIEVRATGPDSEAAVTAIADLIASGFHETD